MSKESTRLDPSPTFFLPQQHLSINFPAASPMIHAPRLEKINEPSLDAEQCYPNCADKKVLPVIYEKWRTV